MTDDRTPETSPTTQMPVPPRNRAERRSRRTIATALAALLLAGAGAVGFLALSGGGEPAATPAAAAPTVAPVPTTPTAAPAPAPAPAPAADTSTDGSGGSQAQDEDVPPPPPPAAPGHLAVSTTHVNLGQNVFSGTFEVRNDGESPIDWSWDASHPAISAAPAGGSLAPGEAVAVTVTVHWQQLGNGGFNFPTHVTGGDQQLNVLVSGSKQVVVNPGVQLPNPQIKP